MKTRLLSCFILAGCFAGLGKAQTIDFSGPGLPGTISYAGGAAPLVGLNISITSVFASGTPMNSGITFPMTGGVLSFTTGNFVSFSGGVYTFASGGSVSISGVIPAISPNVTTWLSGSPATATLSATGFTVTILTGSDTKDPSLVSFFGLPAGTTFTFSGTIQIVVNSGGSGGAVSASAHGTDFLNTAHIQTNVCGLTWGFWKNHVSSWPVTSLMLGSQTYNQTELINLLHTSVGGDASINLAHQLIAAKFNVLNGTNPATAGGAIAAADAVLSTFSGKLPYNVAPSSTVGAQMVAIARQLDFFNSDGAAQPGCTFSQP